jgi:hypothetical protein
MVNVRIGHIFSERVAKVMIIAAGGILKYLIKITVFTPIVIFLEEFNTTFRVSQIVTKFKGVNEGLIDYPVSYNQRVPTVFKGLFQIFS